MIIVHVVTGEQDQQRLSLTYIAYSKMHKFVDEMCVFIFCFAENVHSFDKDETFLFFNLKKCLVFIIIFLLVVGLRTYQDYGPFGSLPRSCLGHVVRPGE